LSSSSRAMFSVVGSPLLCAVLPLPACCSPSHTASQSEAPCLASAALVTNNHTRSSSSSSTLQ
jgi:hypothetical protein